MTELLHAKVSIVGDSAIYTMDVIRHEGALWLVPTWFESPELGQRKPERIVSLDAMQHQDTGNPVWGIVVTHPIPRAVLFAHNLSEIPHGYVVVREPDILLEIPSRTAH